MGYKKGDYVPSSFLSGQYQAGMIGAAGKDAKGPMAGRKLPGWAPWALAGAAGLVSTALNVREARKNREWQEKMSNTSHQREVADLRAAGLNPSLSVMGGGGASTPSGNVGEFDLGKGVASALAVKQAEANIELTKATTAREWSEAEVAAGTRDARIRSATAAAMSGELSYSQAKELLPQVIEEAKQRVRMTAASAKQTEALALLTELERQGYVNSAEFEKNIGVYGPAGKAILEIMRTLKGRR